MNIIFDNVKIYSKRLDTFTSDQLTEAFRELKDSKLALGTRLMHLGILQSGLNNSPITYLGVIPFEYYNGLVKDSFKKFNEADVESNILRFKELFIRNNTFDPFIARYAKVSPLGYGMYGKNYDLKNAGEVEVKSIEDKKPQPVLISEEQTEETKQLTTAEVNRLLGTNYSTKLFDNKIAELKRKVSALNNRNYANKIKVVYEVTDVKSAGGTVFTYKVSKYDRTLNMKAKIENAEYSDVKKNNLYDFKPKEITQTGESSQQLDMFAEESFSVEDESIMQTEEFKNFNTKNPKSSLKNNLEYYKKCK